MQNYEYFLTWKKKNAFGNIFFAMSSNLCIFATRYYKNKKIVFII